jgi:predicted ATPase
MRLDKLILGSAKDSPTHSFKNLKNVTIDFDQGHWVTVLIGWNGTGKSNVLEALAIIFRDLITKKSPEFAYRLKYSMGSGESARYVDIDADPDRKKKPYIIHLASPAEVERFASEQELFEETGAEAPPLGKPITFAKFHEGEKLYLPRYVFGYYSGESTRMRDVFRPYLETHDKLLRSGEDPGLRRLFFALPVHSQFVLLAFLIQQNEVVRKFLDEHLGLDPDQGIDSVLFVLRQPPWWKRKQKGMPEDGDPRLWHARGIVRDFLARLYEASLAPVRMTRTVPVTLWNDKTLEYLYLYVKDVKALRSLVGDQPPAEFFRDLESMQVSELVDEVRIRVRLKKNEGGVTFRELSEGERQLLTVLGLLRFTAEEESLFLLDEPDTHLNPQWSVEYLEYLKQFVGTNEQNRESSHVVLTTHNPLAIAELVKEQVQILHRKHTGAIASEHPEEDPRGMGYAGIVTSDMFGLGSSLDKKTNRDLITLHTLSVKPQLTESEKQELVRIRERVQALDFNFASRDRLEQEFLRARFDLTHDTELEEPIITRDNKQKALAALVTSLLESLPEEAE